jgi:rod shape-determining protein MreC
MPVITADGVVGKVLQVFKSTSLVLLLNDQTSGVGAILEKSRVQGVAKGTASGEILLDRVMNDEQVQPGEKVLTSGGDKIFPKGLPLGTVTKATSGPEVFLNIRVKPAANLARLEEVLVITKKEEKQTMAEETPTTRAADVLAQRLPSVPDKPAADPNKLTEVPKTAPSITPGTPKTNVPPAAASEAKPTAPKSNPAVPPRVEGVAAPQPQRVPIIKPTVSSQPEAGAALAEKSVKPAKTQPASQTVTPPQ